ncbi:MotA/TolQ/ExbB proton channel family protein [Pontibacter sp. G13]|uniref:MotA/TolQ/ExbB proton channel family protein n=1 Tax=Pontibacter sp. G13 TaxID=3074898 RepID=UPI00288A0C73|nr:MotA/TolQ/ExbB proton channel family protein [Pontibacter sp. G13]WNJ16700.1 MotA/TolQ/ExbB proton channel family protein [Pontibacter sp. G13]
MAGTNKPTTSTFSQEANIKPASPFKAIFPLVAIVVVAIVAHVAFYQGFGAPENFEDGIAAKAAYDAWVDAGSDPASEAPHWTAGHPTNTFGLIYKGGFVIPISMTLGLTLFVFVIERGVTIARASGKGNTDVFVKTIRMKLAQGKIEEAAALCDKQKGSVGNVIKAGLRKYKEMEATSDLEKDAKKTAIQAELEEATMLELPMLERNLPIIATIASLGTLVGLIGTVLGMIRAFSALGEGGAPNAAELSVGISEALINTAMGITISALSILFYNFFTTKIDGMTYAMDEAGYSVVQTFDVNN